jgi:hypothetical protein
LGEPFSDKSGQSYYIGGIAAFGRSRRWRQDSAYPAFRRDRQRTMGHAEAQSFTNEPGERLSALRKARAYYRVTGDPCRQVGPDAPGQDLTGSAVQNQGGNQERQRPWHRFT